MKLSIFTMTIRPQPRFQEMADALAVNQRFNPDVPFEWIVVDGRLWYERSPEAVAEAVKGRFPFRHIAPMPSVWQGPTRLTKADYPDLQGARNTALCYATGDYLIELDDCCLPSPTWLASFAQAARRGVGLAGRNQSVRKDKVREGLLLEGEPADAGDTRGTLPRRCDGSWMWGFNCGFPLERALAVNGWDPIYSGQFGGDDVDLGVRLQRTGLALYYAPSAQIHQLLDTHNYAPGPILEGYQNPEWGGIARSDHKPENPISQRTPVELVLETGRCAYANETLIERLVHEPRRTWTIGAQYDIADLRAKCQAGQPFPVPRYPHVYWADGRSLSEMD